MPIGLQQRRSETGWARALSITPLLAIPVLIYNLVVLVGGGGTPDAAALAAGAPVATLFGGAAIDMTMLSGARLILSWGDLLLLLAIVLLLVEVVKATHTGTTAISNHMLSIGLFVLCLIEFLLLADFATSVFFLLAMIVLIDGLAGMVVTIVSARRDFGLGDGFTP